MKWECIPINHMFHNQITSLLLFEVVWLPKDVLPLEIIQERFLPNSGSPILNAVWKTLRLFVRICSQGQLVLLDNVIEHFGSCILNLSNWKKCNNQMKTNFLEPWKTTRNLKTKFCAKKIPIHENDLPLHTNKPLPKKTLAHSLQPASMETFLPLLFELTNSTTATTLPCAHYNITRYFCQILLPIVVVFIFTIILKVIHQDTFGLCVHL